MKKSRLTSLTLLAIFSALALALSFLEAQIMPVVPFMPAGVKPGFSNIITSFAALYFGFGGAMYITAIKALFAFVTRGATAAMMSFCGGAASTVVLCALIKIRGKNLSFIGISVLCACVHNIGQLLCACVLSGSILLLNYAKYLLIFAVISGVVTGTVLNALDSRILNKSTFKTNIALH